MSSKITPDTVKLYKGISEEKWIQGPTFKNGTILHVEYMGGPNQNSVQQRIDELAPNEKLQIKIKDMNNNDTDWLSGYDELDGAFDSPNHDDTYDISLKNYPTGYFTMEGKIINSGNLKNRRFTFIYPRDKFSLKPITLPKGKRIPSLKALSEYKLSTSDKKHYDTITNFRHAGKTKKRKNKKRKNKEQTKKRKAKQSKKQKRKN